MVKMTKEEFLAQRGLRFCTSGASLDRCRFPHGLSARQREKNAQIVLNKEREYQNQRNKAILEYEKKIATGELVDKTNSERTLDNAQGHPDLQSTQAARRLIVKRGIMTEEELVQAITIWDKREDAYD